MKTTHLLLFWALVATGFAQRVPILPQIDLPHNYYYHEQYLPQLTSGTSSLSWTPDGKSLVYSMAGSLWRQAIDGDEAQQLTDGDGYDYQPDVSPDGKSIVFVRYNGKSIELWLLDNSSGKESPLTTTGEVNVEPRWSPDGKSLAFVSTNPTKHFIPYTASWNGQALGQVKALLPDQKTESKRYYYSAFDHGINPAWSRDGKSILLINNHDLAHGTGDIISIDLASGARQTIHHEETEWKTRPDVSPDGTRIVYSSYLGRNWQQLWLLPAKGGYPFPITYGEYDNTNPRWSPDGKQIAFISNRGGNTSLWILDAYQGGQRQVTVKRLNYVKPRVPLTIQVRDENGQAIAARISIIDARQKMYAPPDAWIHSDDSQFPKQQRYEPQYFHQEGTFRVMVPDGMISIKVVRPEYEILKLTLNSPQASREPVFINLKKLALPAGTPRWWSADLHVHMNYGGTYLTTPERLIAQAKAENLTFTFNLLVNKEQRIPNIEMFSPEPDKASTQENIMLYGQEFHTSFWGHLGLLNLRSNIILPDYAGYPQTGSESYFPNNSSIADMAHAQGALVGYVHPYEIPDIFPDQSSVMTHSFPVDAALGKADYFELMGFSDHLATSHVWYKLMNCGLRIPAGAGTDAMANYASLRGPMGLNRVYVRAEGSPDQGKFLKSLKEGKAWVSNGPLIGLKVGNASPGDSIQVSPKGQTLNYTAFLRSTFPIDHFEIVMNGEVVASHPVSGSRTTLDVAGKITVKGPGWILLRAWSDLPNEDLTDIYPFASTNPVFLGSGKAKLLSKASAEYFIKWVDRIDGRAKALAGWRGDAERTAVLNDIARAKTFYVNCLKQANSK